MKPIFLSVTVVALLTACATTATLSDDQRLEIHRAHAGAPVHSFHNLGTLYSWTPLGDSALAVWTRRNQAYLLELGGDCPGLEYGHAISFSGQGGTVFAGMDSVVVLDRGPTNFPCRIQKILPLDVKALKKAEDAARDNVEGK